MSGRAKKAHPGLGACQSEKLELELARSLCASGSITWCAYYPQESRKKLSVAMTSIKQDPKMTLSVAGRARSLSSWVPWRAETHRIETGRKGRRF